jgi:plastocyanin
MSKKTTLSMFALGAIAGAAGILLFACEEKSAPPAPAMNQPTTAAPPPAAAPPAAAPPAAAPPAGAPPAGAPGAAAPAQPAGAVGTQSIKGTVAFTGAPVEMAKQNRAADPYCNKTPMKEEIVVVNSNKTLKNVLVRVTKGITGGLPLPPASPATIEQHECMYRPRVQGIVAGQALIIKNGDGTTHNVHTYKGSTTLFNQAQIAGSAPFEKTFKDDMAMLKFKCDIHPWMTGYVSVTNHPYFAVTGDDGSFEIKNVPPGSYTIEAWHEKFGTKEVSVTVAGDKPSEAKFSFDGTEGPK